MVANFELAALGRAPAHFDLVQLQHWQKEAVHRAPATLLEPWALGHVPAGEEARFVRAVRANLLLPADAEQWAQIVYGELPPASGEIRAAMVEAGGAFFDVALGALLAGGDYSRADRGAQERDGSRRAGAVPAAARRADAALRWP